MEGWYHLLDEQGGAFTAEIGRFYLVAEAEPELEGVS
jgi:uncharacterized protein affecting Mg2+/Co2+ transport